MEIRELGRSKKLFIALLILIMIIPFNVSFTFYDYERERKLGELHSSAISIDFGETLTGSIDFPGEIDNYTFSAYSGDTVLIRMGFVSGSFFDPEIKLYSPSDTSLSSAWGAVLAEITYTLPENGIYKIEARDHQGTYTGTYCIYIQRLNNPGNATLVEFGNNTFGNINYASEADTYTFSANAGDSVLIKMGRISGPSFEQEVRLYSPNGNLLERDWDFSYAAEIYQVLPQNGIYTILACEYTIDLGSYNLFIQRINNPGNAVSFDLGNTTTASIALSGEADTYTFLATAGETVLIRMSEISGSAFDPEIILYSPIGVELARISDSLAAEVSYTLLLDGSYTVLTLDEQGLDGGTYSLSIQIINNPENAIPITFGTTIFGAIDLPGEFDTFTFFANTGDVILITMMKFSGTNLNQEIRLYSPLGTQLARVWDFSYAAEIYYALPQNGEYTIIACDRSSVYTGSYYLFIQRVNNPGNTTTFNLGNTVSGSIGLPSEADTYSFLANAGETVLIRISEVSGTAFNPQLRLYSPTGTLLAQRTQIYSDIELSYTVPLGGSYNVLIRDDMGNGVGVYYISIQNVNNPGNAIPITFGSTIFGVIDFPTEVDTYTFLANSGDSIFIIMASVLGISFNEEIILYSPSGIELRRASGGTVAAEIFYPLQEDGEYKVLVCESDSINTGSYYLYIQKVNNPVNATNMQFGRKCSSITASIGFPSEADTYTFYGSFGDVVDIRMDEVSGTSFSPEIRLYSPTGAELARDSEYDYAWIYHYTLPLDGIYTLLAFDNKGLNIGVYELSFQFPYREYTPAQDTPFLVNTYIDKVFEFGELELTVRFHKLEDMGDEFAFRNTLEEWGINFYDYNKIHGCWLLELGDFYEIFDWFESKIPSIFTSELRANLENYICDDGYIRLSFTTMSNFDYIGPEMQVEILKFLLDGLIKENIAVKKEVFDLLEHFLRLFFDIGIGTNQYVIQLDLKPEFDAADFLINVILEIANDYNIAVHLLKIQDNSISSKKIWELKSFVEAADFVYNTLKLAWKGFIVWIQGGANILSDIHFANKVFTYTLDYLFHYEAGKNLGLDIAYALASSWDPPIARLDLQIRNASTNEILLGYDPATGNTSYYYEYGFFAGDLESQFAIFDISIYPVNLSIINTHLNPSHPPIYLNYSLFFGITNSTTYSSIFNILESDQEISTIMNYGVSEGFIYNQLRINLIDQGDAWVEINITDENGDLVPNPQLKAFYQDNPINATITELSEGRYKIILSPDYTEKEIVIVADKSGYLSNSIFFILGEFAPFEEPWQQIPPISGYILPILILMVLGVVVILMKKQKIS